MMEFLLVFPFYLLVTAGYLVDTSGYLVITSGYLIATTGYFWLLLVTSSSRFSNNGEEFSIVENSISLEVNTFKDSFI